MRVVATSVGFDGKAIRNVGDDFDMPDGSKGTWFEEVKAPAVAKVEEAKGDKAKTKKHD